MLIYKKDTKNKIRSLEIYAEGAILYQYSGLLDWKKVEHIKQCNYKNKGRANERSPIEQAEFEAEALIVKKIREWYFHSKEEAQITTVVMPMLAKVYENEREKVDWENAYIQPKLDGMRCLAFCNWQDVTLMSRKAVEITTMPHIVKQLQSLDLKGEILDGELYLHWESFQENMKLIKKNRKGSEKVKYCVYDKVDNLPFFQRVKDIFLLEGIDFVMMTSVWSEEEMFDLHQVHIKQWYEWTMLRHWIKWYKNNWRDSQLLKVKDFLDETFKVVDVIPMEVYTNQWILVCEDEKGRKFKATPKLSHELKEELLKNKEDYIWQTAEVRFFEYSDDWIPRFPICVWFRLDK